MGRIGRIGSLIFWDLMRGKKDRPIGVIVGVPHGWDSSPT